MFSLNDRKKIIKYLEKNKDKLNGALNNFEITNKKIKDKKFKLEDVLTEEVLIDLFWVVNLFLRFIKSISESFEEEE